MAQNSIEEIVYNQRRFLALMGMLHAAQSASIEWSRVRAAYPEWVDGKETGRAVAFLLDDDTHVMLDRAYACPWMEDSWNPDVVTGPMHPDRYIYAFERCGPLSGSVAQSSSLLEAPPAETNSSATAE